MVAVVLMFVVVVVLMVVVSKRRTTRTTIYTTTTTNTRDTTTKHTTKLITNKGHPPSADLRYGDEDAISPSTLIFAARTQDIYIPPDVPKTLALT